MVSVLLALLALLAGTTTRATAAPSTIDVPPCAQAGPCVVVQVMDGEDQVGPSRFFYAADLLGPDADVTQETSYPRSGGVDAVVRRGSTVARLAALVVGDEDVTYGEVVWPDAYQRHLLTADEVRRPGGTGRLAPTFYSDDAGASTPFLSYIRPQRGPGDPNGADGPDLGTRTTDSGGSLLLRLHLSGSVLTPAVTATPTDDTRRTWTLSTDESGAGTAYDWVLPGGVRSTGTTVTYTFPASSQAGTYPATVGVSRPDGSFGWGEAVLSIGDPPATQPRAATTGPGGVGTTRAGPTRKPTVDQPRDPDPTASGTGPVAPSAPVTAGTGTPAPTGGPASVPGSAPSATPTSTPTSTPTATPTPPALGADVRGVLLSAPEQVAPAAPQVQSDAPRPSASAAPLVDGPFRVATAVWVLGGVLLLLLAGAASESDHLRRRLRRRPRRST